MKISLDWDNTVTADPEGFAIFCDTMRARGHEVYIVTMRYPSECVRDPLMRSWVEKIDGIIPTSRTSKKQVTEDVSIKIDVWIDDHPEAVNLDAKDIWGVPSEEGNVVNVNHLTGDIERAKLDTAADGNYIEIFNKLLLSSYLYPSVI